MEGLREEVAETPDKARYLQLLGQPEESESPEIARFTIGVDLGYYWDEARGNDLGFYTHPEFENARKKCVVFEINGHNAGGADDGVYFGQRIPTNLALNIAGKTRMKNDDYAGRLNRIPEFTNIVKEMEEYHRACWSESVRNNREKYMRRYRQLIECGEGLRKINSFDDEKKLRTWERSWKKQFPEYVQLGLRAVEIQRKIPNLVNAFQNDPQVEEMFNNKSLQQEVIPPELRPREWNVGDSTKSRFGYWICKPISGRLQKGILYLRDRELATYSRFLRRFRTKKYLIQEMFPSSGADNALPDDQGKPCFSRVLIDVVYRKDGTFTFNYCGVKTVALQTKQRWLGPEWSNIDFKNDAHYYKASAREEQVALEATAGIIHNIARKFYSDKIEAK